MCGVRVRTPQRTVLEKGAMIKRRNDRELFGEIFKPVGKPLPERVADKLTQHIIDESYQAGHKLPNEYVLAQRLGVGRSTIREAIRILVSQNVLEVRHGSGTFVCKEMGVVEDPLGFRFFKDKKTLALDLCEIRLMVEPAVAAAAAMHADAGQVLEMEELCRRIEKMFEDDVDHSEADVLLHQKIAAASGNLVAPGIVGIISTAIPLFVHVTNRTLRTETIETHRKVVEAIGRKDPEAARRAMQEHIFYNRDNFKTLPENRNL